MTKRQFLLKYGMNERFFQSLEKSGVIITSRVSGRRNKVTVLQHSLIEGEHYVVCKECGAHLGSVTTKHLKAAVCEMHRPKTEEEKKRQSETLKHRFTTPEGEATKKQISEAAKAMQKGGYSVRAAEHLRAMGQDPAMRARRVVNSKEMWEKGTIRETLEAWRAENKDYVAASAANARAHLSTTTSKVHLSLKAAIDEADPVRKIAIEVDGCYWHGCALCGLSAPGKAASNDRRKNTYLENKGWRVIRVRECEIRKDIDVCVGKILLEIENGLKAS